MPLIQRKGGQSSQGFGEFAQSTAATYIEDVFSTYLYTGNGATGQTITNNVDLSTYGGMLWIKDRASSSNHCLVDTARGKTTVYNELNTNNTNAQNTSATYGVSTITTSGFSLTGGRTDNNGSGETYASWTFRKQAKFFDIVTYTGTGANRTIAHNLGSVPGCIIVKRTDTTGNWQVYHNGLTSAAYSIQLNLTNAQASATTVWNSTAPTSTVFSVGTDATVNANGGTYVAYLFAHDAGGFGLNGTDNVISCGSASGVSGSQVAVTLGWEPQFVILRSSNLADQWNMYDNMRGMVVGGVGNKYLRANASTAEGTDAGASITPTATGFTFDAGQFSGTGTYIYIAIRRGPMKTPTSGTEVFAPAIGNNSTSAGGEIFTTNFPVDFFMRKVRATTDFAPFAYSRLTAGKYLVTGTTAAEATDTSTWFDTNTGIDYQYASNFSGQIGWLFQRAPGFFDEVCYTGTGANTTQTHNLGVVPELMIVKERSAINAWQVYSATLANTQYLVLNTTAAAATGATRWNSTTPTSSVFSIGTDSTVNASTQTYVAYLFASCPGVSKIGSYSGTGATQTIDCGFTSGARFVLIKRTNSTGDWYVWDTARGMVSGTDPYLLLDSTAAEVNANNVYTTGVGFQIVGTGAGINASGGTYIFWAVS